MKIYELKMSFGWDDDNGIGDMLIRQIIEGKKTATCSFKILYTQEELEELYSMKGKVVTVLNHNNEPKCNIRILDVFETTYGNPDLRLVRGEGDGEDVAKFQRDHQIAWESTVQGKPLTEDTVFIAELFELTETVD